MKKGADSISVWCDPQTKIEIRPLLRYFAAAAEPLIRLATLLLARTFSRQRLFGAAPITRLQVVRMLLDILDDIFLLYFPFEATERAFNRFAFLNLDFSQA
jgi:hypothetical protein